MQCTQLIPQAVSLHPSGRPIGNKKSMEGYTCRSASTYSNCLLLSQLTSTSGRGQLKSNMACRAAVGSGPGSERGERADSGNGLASKAESLSVLNSDTDFLLKLVGISFGGAVIVKWGSLLIDTPFEHNPFLAAAMVFGPPILYGVALTARGGSKSQ